MLLFVFLGRNFTFPILLLIGFFLLAPTPVFLAIIHNIKTDHLPFINGLYMTSNFLVGSIATLITGYAFDHLGNSLTFRISAFLAFAAIPIVLLLKEK
jgi:FSR family fosmidomycin resistance protein-like MFS transporter